MMGPKKLSEIRQELKRHFSTDRRNPITGLKAKTPEGKAALDVVESLYVVLKRIVQPPKKPRRTKKR